MASSAKAALETIKEQVGAARQEEREAMETRIRLAELRVQLAKSELSDEAEPVKENMAGEEQQKMLAQDRRIAQLELEIFDLENGRSMDFGRYYASYGSHYALLGAPTYPPSRAPAYSPIATPAYPPPRIPTPHPSTAYRESYFALHGDGVPRSNPYPATGGRNSRTQHGSFEPGQHFDERERPRYSTYRPTFCDERPMSPTDRYPRPPPSRSTPYGPYRPDPYANHDLYSGAPRPRNRSRVRFA